ncbi:hypothetical protein CDL15_Pgr017414 [Punica granatum]|uniref:Uncharacterized protein n=1 Tax=Punica granatum TaxID=22663 RepID=A0A218Y3Q9_PUNGR|nr:hypothetical protein CDL15_Pgr017414 [Punica granatum]
MHVRGARCTGVRLECTGGARGAQLACAGAWLCAQLDAQEARRARSWRARARGARVVAWIIADIIVWKGEPKWGADSLPLFDYMLE